MTHGTTSIVPTTLTCPDHELERVFACFDAARQTQAAGPNLIGLHLEGPYFFPDQAGAQDPAYLKTPEKEDYRRIFDACPQIIRMSAAPELPGGLKLGDEMRRREIRYAVDNIGRDTMYCSVGSHCTYLAPFSGNERREDCCLLFSGPQHAGRLILEGSQIIGKIDDFFQGRQMLPLKGLFEQASIIMETADLTSPVISIFNRSSGVGTQVSFEGFRYCICWAPKGEDIPFVCIEPWTGMVDQAALRTSSFKRL